MDAQQFLAEFGHIANAPKGVEKLRELIYQLAISGTLTAQLDDDGDARSLLAEISTQRAKLIAEKKLQRERVFPEISTSEVLADSPRHWCWVRFGDLWHLLSGRDLEPSQYNDSEKGIPYITGASNIESGVINVNRWTPSPIAVSGKNDLLITCN